MIECGPTVKAVVVQEACPVAGLTVTAALQPATGLLPSMNVTEPESNTGAENGVTVAVKVTGVVMMDGLTEDVSARLVAA